MLSNCYLISSPGIKFLLSENSFFFFFLRSVSSKRYIIGNNKKYYRRNIIISYIEIIHAFHFTYFKSRLYLYTVYIFGKKWVSKEFFRTSLHLTQMAASLYRGERRALISKTLLRISTIKAVHYDSRVIRAGIEMRDLCRVKNEKQAFQCFHFICLFSLLLSTYACIKC